MSKPFVLYPPLPDQSHLLLLKACLLPPDKAIGYFKEWSQLRGIDKLDLNDEKIVEKIYDPLDSASQRLLTLLYRNLESVNDPIVKKLRGIYRQHWVLNQHKMQRGKEVVRIFQQEQIPTMLIKGSALLAKYYRNVGERALGDFDLMVPIEYKDKACQILKNPPLSYHTPPLDKVLEPFSHAVHFLSPDKMDLDLHWHLIHELRYDDADKPFWAQRELVTLDAQTQTSVPSPTHFLLHTIVHGMKPEAVSPIRWIADAYVIVRERGKDIDWNYLLKMIQNHRFTLFFQKAIDLLIKEFDVDIPNDFVQKLAVIPTTPKEKQYYAWIIGGNDFRSLPMRILMYPQKAKMMHELFLRGKMKQNFTRWFSKRFLQSLFLSFRVKW